MLELPPLCLQHHQTTWACQVCISLSLSLSLFHTTTLQLFTLSSNTDTRSSARITRVCSQRAQALCADILHVASDGKVCSHRHFVFSLLRSQSFFSPLRQLP